MFLKGLVTILGCALLFAILATPLIFRKVPRNIVYGFRTCATLRDDSIWYEVNAYFGRRLLISSLVTCVAILVLYCVPGVSQYCFFLLSLVVLLVPLFLTILLTLRFSRSLTPRGPAKKQSFSTSRQ